MVQIDEQRPPGTVHVPHAGRGSYVVEPLAFAIVEQIALTAGADRKQVGPAVIVVVCECRESGAGRERQRHVCADVRDEPAVHRIESGRRRGRGEEEVVFTVAVVIAHRQRGRCSAQVREAGLAGDIGELDFSGRRAGRDAAHCDQRLRAERQHGPADEWPFDSVHFGERRLVWRRDLGDLEEPIERGARVRQSPGP